jgi:para-aminobenzoate synthetase/4-amino-4-deoxychorismate lyase
MDNVFALLDDASAEGHAQARSRLYTGHAGTLACVDAVGWNGVLHELQAALARGLYAVPVLTYELGAHLLGIPTKPLPGPLAQVLLFERCELLDAGAVQGWIATRAGTTTPAGVAAVTANVDEARFVDAINRIRAYIAAGDTYQVNYTYRLRFDAFGSVYALYSRLRARQPVPYGALVGLPDGGAVLSFSPELFVRHTDGTLLARPMKGTAPASDDEAVNRERAAALALDPKNRAENLMIVDLLRNDLGRVAQTGSVTVPKLFEVTRFGAVLQMTSTVQARLRADVTLAGLFAALYPCGSITGAPKRRTMEIIDELEPDPRGLYTGAIGWFDPPDDGRAFGDFCLSVPIRTLALGPGEGLRRGELGVGAGIVYDSDPQGEYAECKLKARFLTGLSNDFDLFETIKASWQDGPRHLELHLARMAASARYFGRPFDESAAQTRVRDACLGLAPESGVHRLRLALGADGALTITTAPLAPLHEPVGVLLADTPTDSNDIFLRHKTSVRSRYDAAWRAAEAQGGVVGRTQQRVRAPGGQLVHAAAVLRPAAGRDARCNAGRAGLGRGRARHHERNAGAGRGDRGVQCVARAHAGDRRERAACRLASQRALDFGHQLRIFRRHLAREVRDDLAIASDQVLREIPFRLLAGLPCERGVQRVGVGAGHHGRREHREFHAIGVVAEVRDFLGAGGFLFEVVGGKAEDHQAARAVFGVQLFQALVLLGVAAVAGRVHHQHHFAGVLAQVLRRLVLQALEALFEQGRAAGRRRRGGDQGARIRHARGLGTDRCRGGQQGKGQGGFQHDGSVFSVQALSMRCSIFRQWFITTSRPAARARSAAAWFSISSCIHRQPARTAIASRASGGMSSDLRKQSTMSMRCPFGASASAASCRLA